MKNGFYYKQIRLFLLFWILLTPSIHAQPNLAFYPLNKQFNSYNFNPAFLTSPEKFTFSIFPLAGISFSYNNQEIVRKIATEFISGTITHQEYEDIFNRMLKHSAFHQSAEIPFLNFTYRSKHGFYNFNIKDRQYLATSIRGEIIDFIFMDDTPSAPIGKKQFLPVQSAHFREYSLGYAHTSRDKRLSAGIRAKLYYGKFAFYTDIRGSIESIPDNYALTAYGMANISFPGSTIVSPNDSTNTVDFTNKTISNYLFNTGNPGMGLDLGINYQVNPKLNISLSMIDLGKINWKSNIASRFMDKQYPLFSSRYITDTINGLPVITKIDRHNYSQEFDFFKLSRDSATFIKALPTHIYAGIKYQVNPQLSLSINNRYTIIKHLNYNSISFTANVEVNPKFSISSGYAIIDGSHFNIPLALMHTGNLGQVYLGTDNLISFVSPTSGDFAALSFGACFYLFTHRNLLLKRDENTPFYQPRKTIKNKGSGFIIKARKKE